MKNIHKLIKIMIFSLAIIMLLASCGGGGNNKVFGDSGVIEMVLGTVYTVNTGDKVIPNGPTTIVVEHTLNTTTKIVQITSGSATLLRGDYAIN